MTQPLNLLAFDTCLAACSAAVLKGGSLAAHRLAILDRGHAEALMPMAVAVLAEAGLKWEDLEGLGVTHGPGTFTGLRVGLAAARGIALARGLPVAAFSSLHALAAGAVRAGDAGATEPILAVSDARRGEVYLQAFGPGATPLGPPELLPLAAAARRAPMGEAAIVGSGVDLLLEVRPEFKSRLRPVPDRVHPDAQDVAALAAAAMAAPDWSDPGPPRPVYIRAPHAAPRKDKA